MKYKVNIVGIDNTYNEQLTYFRFDELICDLESFLEKNTDKDKTHVLITILVTKLE